MPCVLTLNLPCLSFLRDSDAVGSALIARAIQEVCGDKLFAAFEEGPNEGSDETNETPNGPNKGTDGTHEGPNRPYKGPNGPHEAPDEPHERPNGYNEGPSRPNEGPYDRQAASGCSTMLSSSGQHFDNDGGVCLPRCFRLYLNSATRPFVHSDAYQLYQRVRTKVATLGTGVVLQ